MKHSIFVLSVLLFALVCGVPTPASAQQGEDPSDGEEADEASAEKSGEASEATFKELTTRGAKAFKAKEYAKARDAFQKAYEIKPVPNLLYNIGRVSEKMGEFEEAVSFYEKFVNEPDIDMKARKDALDRINTLEEVIAMREKGEEVDEAQVAEKQSDRGLAGPDEGDEPRVERDYTMAWIFTGVGVAALAGGGIFAWQTNVAHDEFNNAGTLAERRDAADRGRTSAILADSLIGVGAVLTGVGVYFFISPPEREVRPKGASMNLTPQIGPHAAGMSLTVDF